MSALTKPHHYEARLGSLALRHVRDEAVNDALIAYAEHLAGEPARLPMTNEEITAHASDFFQRFARENPDAARARQPLNARRTPYGW